MRELECFDASKEILKPEGEQGAAGGGPEVSINKFMHQKSQIQRSIAHSISATTTASYPTTMPRERHDFYVKCH